MIVLLIATRNEAGLLRHNLEHHLGWGIDHVAVADNESTDETQDVLRGFRGSVSAVVYSGDMTRRLPALVGVFRLVEDRYRSVDWAGVSDTDEFWWTPDTHIKAILASMPAEVLGVNFQQKLFRPTELDLTEGPVFCRRTFCASGVGSPLHTSYRKGKSFYRGSWLREHGLSNSHWCREIPHPPRRYEQPLVHHYMIDDEDSFVRKMKRLETLHPEIRDGSERPPIQDFKRAWWQVYAERGEEGIRDYYRADYLIKSEDVPGHVARGELVHDTAFADFKTGQLHGPTPAARSRNGDASPASRAARR